MKYIKLFILVFVSVVLFSCKAKLNSEKVFQNTKISGVVFGSFYEVTYDSSNNYEKQFDSLFYVINKSMSTYQDNSDISKLNRSDNQVVDEHFVKVYEASKRIYQETDGAFDPTIGIIVNAWDFGPQEKLADLNKSKIDSLMAYVGFDKVSRQANTIVKPKETFIDFNAICPGYVADLVAQFLDNKKIENYMINIGGELKTKGVNKASNEDWLVGIEKPNFDGTQSLHRTLVLKDAAMATSGTYRKFKIDETGNRYAHIIDTKTGQPSKTNLLSISVIAKDCIHADAYATAFKVMGVEKIKAFLKTHPELQVFLIFENSKKELETLSLNGFPEN